MMSKKATISAKRSREEIPVELINGTASTLLVAAPSGAETPNPSRQWAIELVGSWDSARGVAASRLVAFVAC